MNTFNTYDNPSVAARQFKNVLTPNGRLYLLDRSPVTRWKFIRTLLGWINEDNRHLWHPNEVIELLDDHHYHITYSDSWNYRYHKLFLVVCGFQLWQDFHLES